MQYNRMRVAVGLFVISLIVGFFIFLYFILEKKGTFEDRYNYYFYTKSANSFNIGMPLKFSGFTVGVIDNITLEDSGLVKMTFSVTQNNQKWIAKDTILLLRKPLIGSPHIEVYTKVGNTSMQEGSTLKIILSDDINDMITKLEPAVDNIINIISSLEKISYKLARDDSNILQTFKNINKFSAKLARDDSILTSITGDAQSSKDFIDALSQTKDIIKDIKNITSQFEENIFKPTTSSMKELELIMKDIHSKLKAIDSTVKIIGKFDNDLLDLKDQLAVGLEKSNTIMDKMDMLLTNNKSAKIVLP